MIPKHPREIRLVRDGSGSHGVRGDAEVSRVWLSRWSVIDLLAKDVAVSCVPGKFFDHGEQGPSHADCSFTGVVLGVIEVEAGDDLT